MYTIQDNSGNQPRYTVRDIYLAVLILGDFRKKMHLTVFKVGEMLTVKITKYKKFAKFNKPLPQ